MRANLSHARLAPPTRHPDSKKQEIVLHVLDRAFGGLAWRSSQRNGNGVFSFQWHGPAFVKAVVDRYGIGLYGNLYLIHATPVIQLWSTRRKHTTQLVTCSYVPTNP